MEKINSECLAVKWELLQLIVLLMILTGTMNYLYPTPNINQPALKYIILSFVINFIFFIICLPVYIFAIPDVITRKKGAFSALIYAYFSAGLLWKKIILSYGMLFLAYFLLIALYIILMPSLLITIISLKILIFVLSIWIIPLCFAVSAILFKDSYGLKATRLSP